MTIRSSINVKPLRRVAALSRLLTSMVTSSSDLDCDGSRRQRSTYAMRYSSMRTTKIHLIGNLRQNCDDLVRIVVPVDVPELLTKGVYKLWSQGGPPAARG